MYIDVKHTDSIKLRMNIDYSKDPNRLRKWNIRITQLPCRSPRLAPPGCLQYYEDYSGTIKSFNYGPIGVNETSYPLGVRYVYGVDPSGLCPNHLPSPFPSPLLPVPFLLWPFCFTAATTSDTDVFGLPR